MKARVNLDKRGKVAKREDELLNAMKDKQKICDDYTIGEKSKNAKKRRAVEIHK